MTVVGAGMTEVVGGNGGGGGGNDGGIGGWIVTPAYGRWGGGFLDSRFRGNDGDGAGMTVMGVGMAVGLVVGL